MHHFFGGEDEEGEGRGQPQHNQPDQGLHIQLCRRYVNTTEIASWSKELTSNNSVSKWSHGTGTEHSIANAYIQAITNAEHYVYIENQFFITATCNEQHPVANKIGKAIVDRIVRAHQSGQNFRVVVIMPAVPAFAGDLKADAALGTRAIMEFQYNSINRGGHSILESLRTAGVSDPARYIGFYNLRNYDRINVSAAMGRVEQQAGVSYQEARQEFDDAAQAGADAYGRDQQAGGRLGDQYRRYQEAASQVHDRTWDTISACYMAAGPNLDQVPWGGDEQAELMAFVSEELYIHSKVLIADDRLVICGSANLNDRSQLGDHDSEIAVVIEDPAPVRSAMGGQPFTASRFAASLRRQLYRKHLGLLADQPCDQPNGNWRPVTAAANEYDWGSAADELVVDPLSEQFLQLWAGTARTNTEAFSDVFHNVPNDHVRTWEQYDDFFSRHFIVPGAEEKGKDGQQQDTAGKVDYGHVVPGFPGGLAAVKQRLSQVRGNLVEMPLDFLIDVDDIAKEGLSLNALTDELYT
jgi:phospholipase D1/2